MKRITFGGFEEQPVVAGRIKNQIRAGQVSGNYEGTGTGKLADP